MNTTFTVTLALAAGFLGGLGSRFFIPARVYAQAPPQEIRAEKFVLVDEQGVARGVFGVEANGAPLVEVLDSKGRVLSADFAKWRSGSLYREMRIKGPKQPTLLAEKP